MNSKENLKPKFLKVFADNLGIISPSCKTIGIDRKTYYTWREKDKDFDEACKEIEETQGDMVENKLLNRIVDGDTIATIFYCKTKLKNRGYVERQELTGKDGEQLRQTVIQVADNDTAKLLGNIQTKGSKGNE